MAEKPETTFRKRVIPSLKTLPNTVIFPIQQVSISGTPDLLLCINGHFVALEFKKDAKARVTELQKYNLNRIIKAGGFSFVVFPENWQDVFNNLKHLSEENYGEVDIRRVQKSAV